MNSVVKTLIGCCVIHLCIGSVYALSVLYPDIIDKTGWDITVLVTGFSLTILSLGLTAAFHQKIFKGHHVYYVVSYGIISWFVTSSLLFSNIILDHNYIAVHYIFSFLWGISIGLLYVVPINLVSGLNFSKKSLASGSVVGCFGLGSILSAKIFSNFIDFSNVSMLFFTFICSALMLWGIKYINITEVIEEPEKFNRDEKWYFIALMFLLNIGIGVSLLSNLTQFSLSHGLELFEAVRLVALAGLANTLGRFIYSALGDKLDKFSLLGIMFQIQLITLLVIKAGILLEVSIVVIISVYGGMFAILPSLLKQTYNNTSAYSQMLVMWGISGMIFPVLFSYYGINLLVLISSLLVLNWVISSY